MIAGNVGKDAVLRRTQGGDPVLGFSVAVDNGKDKNGNKRDSTWYSCSIWGKRAESLENYIKKGTKLALTGRVGVDVYEGRGSLTLNVNELTFQGGGQQGEQRGYDTPPASDDFDDDIPF
jgi:single-strand DNA-binding protein